MNVFHQEKCVLKSAVVVTAQMLNKITRKLRMFAALGKIDAKIHKKNAAAIARNLSVRKNIANVLMQDWLALLNVSVIAVAMFNMRIRINICTKMNLSMATNMDIEIGILILIIFIRLLIYCKKLSIYLIYKYLIKLISG